MIKIDKARLKELKEAGVYRGQIMMAPVKSIAKLLEGVLPEEKVIKLFSCHMDNRHAILGITTTRAILVHSFLGGVIQKDLALAKVTSISNSSTSVTLQAGSDKIEAKYIGGAPALKELTTAVRNPESFSAYNVAELFQINLNVNSGKTKKGNGLSEIFRFIGMVLFGLFGFPVTASALISGDFFSFFVGVFFLITAAFLAPQMAKYFTRTVRILVAIGSFIMAMVVMDLSSQKEEEMKVLDDQKDQEMKALEDDQVDKIFATIGPLLTEQKFDSAVFIANKIKYQYSNQKHNPATQFLKEYEILNNNFLFNKKLLSISPKAFENLDEGIFTGSFLKDSILNSLFIAKVKNNPDVREKLLLEKKHEEEVTAKRIAQKEEQEAIKKLAEMEQAAKKKDAEIRQEKLVSQFSLWDGSHKNLEKFIKASMNDEDSYEHIETIFVDRGDHLRVSTTFSGKNAFNATVKHVVKAKVSLDGEILEILE